MNMRTLSLIILVPLLCGQSQPATQPADADRTTSYAEGVRIVWKDKTVELDATVCLRHGDLELFACSPRTKEHESIVVVHARPKQIFEAMGLIGLEPGAPASYDPETDKSTAARGAKLRIDVAYRDGQGEKSCGIHEWMRPNKGGRPLTALDWVFAGSAAEDEGGFAADSEGTVICVVDFDSAVISLAETHTSDDAELWLKPNTERIPPRGTKCLVRIRAAESGATQVTTSKPADSSPKR